MNSDLQNLTPKTEDGGTTPQGRLAAAEWNILLEAVKLLDRSSGELDTSEVLGIVQGAGYATRDWVDEFVKGSFNLTGYITAAEDQDIEGIKNFVNGFRVGGSPLIVYDEATKSFFFDGNIVASGGMASRAALGDLDAPAIMDALVVDEQYLKVEDGVLKFVGQTGGGGGGIDEDFLSRYLSNNRYATQDWVLSQRYLTGISSTMVTDALGFTPLSIDSNAISADALTFESIADLNDATAGRVFTTSNGDETLVGNKPREGWISGITLALAANRYYKRQLAFSATDDIYFRRQENGTWRNWGRLLTSSNYGEFALPITGGTVKGSLTTTGDMVTPSVIIGGIKIYKSADGNLFLDGNLSVKGGVTSRASDGYTPPSLFDALPIDGISIKRNSAGALYSPFIVSGGTVDGDITCRELTTSQLAISTASGWASDIQGGTTARVVTAHPDGYGQLIMSTRSDANYIFRVWQGSLTGATGSGKALLDVLGSGQVKVGGNLLVAGSVTPNTSSDLRLKRNFEDINASEILMSLGKVQSYEYIDSEIEKNSIYDGRHIGLIYQSVVGSALDRMCFEREDGFGALNYIEPSFIALLAGVGQEHELRLRSIEERLYFIEGRG